MQEIYHIRKKTHIDITNNGSEVVRLYREMQNAQKRAKMRVVSIKMTDEEIAYIAKQKPNRSEFIRRLIHQHKDMQGLQAIVEGLRRQREEDEGCR